jgi:uncharacterized cofD-like protein
MVFDVAARSRDSLHSIVCLGGGNGSPKLLAALHRRFPAARFSSIVACTDEGRSTGVIRHALNIPPPGDVRNSLTTLAGDRSPWAALLERRLSAPGRPDLDGMAIGNLLLGVLTQDTGNLGEAALILARLLQVDIPVLPASVENLHLCAILVDGSVIRGEVAVRQLDKPAIREVFIEGEQVGIWAPAREALLEATTLVIGPGSLWTSLAATLSVRGIREAIEQSEPRIVFVCNTTTQPGQTDGLDAVAHVEVVSQALGRPPDFTLLNHGTVLPEIRETMERDGLCLLDASDETIASMERVGTRVLCADLLSRAVRRETLWNKMDTAYHDMERTADMLLPLLELTPQT